MFNQRITGIAWGDLAGIDIDECETQNRYLDAWLEAEHIQRERKKKG